MRAIDQRPACYLSSALLACGDNLVASHFSLATDLIMKDEKDPIINREAIDNLPYATITAKISIASHRFTASFILKISLVHNEKSSPKNFIPESLIAAFQIELRRPKEFANFKMAFLVAGPLARVPPQGKFENSRKRALLGS